MKDLHNNGVDVLVLEGSESLRELVRTKSRNEKHKIIEGISSFPCRMFRDLLSYKCLDIDILTMTEDDYQYQKEHSEYKVYTSNNSSFEYNKRFMNIFTSLSADYDTTFLMTPDGHLRQNLTKISSWVFPCGEGLWDKVNRSDFFQYFLSNVCFGIGEKKSLSRTLELALSKKHRFEKSFPSYPGELYDYSFVRNVVEEYEKADQECVDKIYKDCYEAFKSHF